MIEITDLSLLKIIKVKNWAINFDYDDVHYLLHGGYECGEGSWQDLYIRTLDENGHYELEHLKTKMYSEENVSHDYIKRQSGSTIVYRNVDKEFFAYKLTKRGFATGIMENKVSEEQKKIQKVEKQIKKYEEKIRELRNSIRDLK